MPDTQPLRLPLIISAETRDETSMKDARLINGYIETVGKEDVWVYKRPGMSAYAERTAAAGLGLFRWENRLYEIWGSTVYEDGVALTGAVDTTNGVYTFTSGMGATPQLFLHNGVKSYTYSYGGSVTEVTDGDYPSNLVKGCAFLDGTFYVLADDSRIYGSDINDASSWDPQNYLIAQIDPSAGVALTKQLVYVVALKQASVEFFYDAGNAVDSPLGPVQGAKISVGCGHADSVRDIDGILLWLGASKGNFSVMSMEGLKAKTVSTPAIERILQKVSMTTVYSWTVKVSGHRFYVLTFPASNVTLVYDITFERWYYWADADGNYLPIVAAAQGPDNQPLVQHASNGKIYELDSGVYLDDGELISLDLYTPNVELGTRMRKYLQSVDFIADRTVGSILEVRNSDNDYKSWSNPRRVDLGLEQPRLVNCGSFRRRAYHLHHACNTPLRLKAVELRVEGGTL